jgi:diadenosine tetraphosphate (Ap4A) HIT family hydrolase
MQEGDAHIKQNWPLMTLRNRIVWVVCDLRAANNVPPVHAHFVASFDGDDLGANRGLEARFAGDVGVVDVAN